MIADSDNAGPRLGKCKIIWKKKQQKNKNDFQNNKFDKISNEKNEIKKILKIRKIW